MEKALRRPGCAEYALKLIEKSYLTIASQIDNFLFSFDKITHLCTALYDGENSLPKSSENACASKSFYNKINRIVDNAKEDALRGAQAFLWPEQGVQCEDKTHRQTGKRMKKRRVLKKIRPDCSLCNKNLTKKRPVRGSRTGRLLVQLAEALTPACAAGSGSLWRRWGSSCGSWRSASIRRREPLRGGRGRSRGA